MDSSIKTNKLELDFYEVFTKLDKAMLITDINGKILHINKTFIKMMGKDLSEQIYENSIGSIVHPNDKAVWKNLLEKVNNDLKFECHTVEIRFLFKNSFNWLKLSVFLLNQKSTDYLLIVLEDESYYKYVYNSIAKSKDRFQSLLDTIQDIIITINDHGVILFINRAIKSVFGYEPKELLAHSIEYLIPNFFGTIESINIIRRKLPDSNRVRWDKLELIGKHKNGKRLILDVFIVEYSEDYLHFLTVFIKDVTEQKIQEVRLQNYNEQLEKTVEKRVEELTYLNNELLTEIYERVKAEKKANTKADELKDLNNKLEKAINAKSGFFAKVSHELRTPLSLLIAKSQMLEQGFYGELTAEQLKQISEIIHHSNHLLNLINDILDISKISSGKMVLNKTDFSLTNLLKDIINYAKNLTYDKDITVLSELEEDISIYADPMRIKQIIYNFISNAVKFTEKGFITVFLLEIPNKIIVGVEDTGIGIPEKDLENVFSDFYQSTVKIKEGTGLGLSIAKNLTNLHGGEICLQSVLNKGSEFFIVLPKRKLNKNIKVKNG